MDFSAPDLRSVHFLQLPKGAQFLALNFSELLQLRTRGTQRIAEVAQVVQEIRNVWNPLVVEGGLRLKRVRGQRCGAP